MDIFDGGGIVSFIALVMSVIIGIGIWKLLHSMFDIMHFGIGAVISFFFGCVVAGAMIVNIIAGLLFGFLSVIWGLIKLVVGIAIIGSIGIFIYNKLSVNREEESTGNEEI